MGKAGNLIHRWEVQPGTTNMEVNVEDPLKWPNYNTSRHFPNVLHTLPQRYLHAHLARRWNQSRCLSIYKWVTKIWYRYTMGFYSAIKKHEIHREIDRSGKYIKGAKKSNTTCSLSNVDPSFKVCVYIYLYICKYECKSCSQETTFQNN